MIECSDLKRPWKPLKSIDIFYQDEFENNYIGLGRKIEGHSLVDKEHQQKQWHFKGFRHREIPLPTLLVTRIQVLSTKSRESEAKLGLFERFRDCRVLSTKMNARRTTLGWVERLGVALWWTQDTKKTNSRCKRFHDRELPLQTWVSWSDRQLEWIHLCWMEDRI